MLVPAEAAKGRVESAVDYMVSVVETHRNFSRGILNKERLEDETLVDWNGEDVVHCDPLAKEVISLYSSEYKIEGYKEGHFISSECIK